LAHKSAKSREIPREFELIAGYGYRRASLTVTLDASPTVSEILTFKARKWLVFPTPPLFDDPARGDPLEILHFVEETYPTRTRGMGLLYIKNFTIQDCEIFNIQ